ncbi:uncharacterized protein Z518_01101 [Rhinocladiella mackenziei CBS 650.93]|uniref:Tat pathway signal sequence n=1 Tax=Rhinocladiella mackenziei CBS 650.93 TaxID=1442369 RepID=A0A0D2JKQ3_9EURO|nr:uncharacterized protein Z518_01101 [Rhinocladiella mackenziei CBS 650.93]KIX10020.1 hypothetical protein Z518_01101 [Rhinocladiella mackenziei CBS 650.93]
MSRLNYKYTNMKWEGPSMLREKEQEQEEEEDGLLSGSHESSRPKSRRWLSYALAFMLGLSVFINIVALLQQRIRTQDMDELCSTYTSENPSPISQDVKIAYSTTEFNGSFLNPSPYTLIPGPDVDEAWLALGTQSRHYVVPEHLGTYYGLNPGHVKLSPKDGGGFPVLFEFEHHLHCVNLLRQSSYWNYDYYSKQGNGPFRNPPDIVRRHVNHCLDILRQVIMCQPDTGVFGQYWVRETNEPFVDFHTKHRCKNFEEMKDWVLSHQMPDEKAKVVQRPGDIVLDVIP